MAKKQTQKKTSARGSVKAVKKGQKKNIKNNHVKGKSPYAYAAAGAWTILAAVLIGIFTYGNAQGVLAGWINDAMFGLFSVTAYLVPPVIFALGVYVFKVKRTNKLALKICLSIIEIILIGSLVMLFSKGEFPMISTLWGYGIDNLGGGVLGGTLAILLSGLIGKAASIVVVLVLIAVILSLILKISFVSILDSFASGYRSVREEFDEVEDIDLTGKGKDVSEKLVRVRKKRGEISEKQPEPAADIDVFSHGEEKTDKKEEKPEKEQKTDDAAEEVAFDPDVFLEGVAAQLPQTEGVKELLEEQKKKNAENEKPKKVSAATEEEKTQVSDEIEKSIEKPVIEYKMPPIDLLKKVEAVSSDKRREMYETANKLVKVLKDFGVEAKLLQVTQGPTVTRYEIQPSTGVKLAKITGLAEDIALNLAVPTVLVAAVPGKAAVGIEVPNNTVGTVSARELMESESFKKAKSKLSVALGKDIGGNVVIGDIAKFPHVLIAGSTGSGKSVCINTIITSILYKARPDEVKLIMIDPKVVELGVYNGIPHLLIPVVTDPKKAAGALNWAVGEMMRRYALFAETATRNLEGYNEHIEKEGGERLPQIVIVIDELADLMMVAAKEVEDYICRLAQLARAAGLHLIIATQRPSVDVITGLIKANVPSRIAFAVSSGVDSRTILDKVGAEKLLGKGDMLYHPTGLPNALRVQGAYVSDEEIENIINFIKEHSEQTNYAHDLEEHIERMATGENGVTDEDEGEDADELLPQAIELAAELGQISTAMIQRKMKVGYARAGRIIDQMETRGLISGANGSKPRDVYLNRIRGVQEDMFDTAEDEEEYDEE
ncbi:MAG: DNA translocase FtsK 4TM domain-containing protein [Clostridia bacterium]|nr:DNA translocase FtsK 4TM domain-containing protein [Clostridia bacterium]